MPEVREELIIEVRNGRISLETSWRREEGVASRGQVVAWLDVIIPLPSSEVNDDDVSIGLCRRHVTVKFLFAKTNMADILSGKCNLFT